MHLPDFLAKQLFSIEGDESYGFVGDVGHGGVGRAHFVQDEGSADAFGKTRPTPHLSLQIPIRVVPHAEDVPQ